MRPTNSGRRPRGRSQNRKPYPSKNHVYDSHGPTQRVRGTAQQVHEKYAQLARDAASSGNHLLAESYQQHGEHYLRVHNQTMEAQQAFQQQQNERRERQQDSSRGDAGRKSAARSAHPGRASHKETQDPAGQASRPKPNPSEEALSLSMTPSDEQPDSRTEAI